VLIGLDGHAFRLRGWRQSNVDGRRLTHEHARILRGGGGESRRGRPHLVSARRQQVEAVQARLSALHLACEAGFLVSNFDGSVRHHTARRVGYRSAKNPSGRGLRVQIRAARNERKQQQQMTSL
jgi:hypothetical protein